MTEKRSQYRKRQRQSQRRDSLNRLLDRAKLDQNNSETDDVDVNPEFTRSARRSRPDDYAERENFESERATPADSSLSAEDKVKRLKKRLNWAIVIVLLLLIFVLVALFKF